MKLDQKGFAQHLIIPIVAVMVIASVGAYVVTKSKASELSAKTAPKKVLVIGDSITANYIDPSKHGKGWWTYLAADTGAKVLLSAEGGSGYVRRGRGTVNKECATKGTTFGGRISDAIKKNQPDYIIIEGGRNDASFCNKDNKLQYATDKRITDDVSDFFNKLVKEAKAQGVPAKNIYVFTPWSKMKDGDYARVTTIIQKQAAKAGVAYIPSVRFSEGDTIQNSPNDYGFHPTKDGSKHIYEQLRDDSFLDNKLRGEFSDL